MPTFDWSEVCSASRLDVGMAGTYPSSPEGIPTFAHRDAETIINSSAFRRLQGKTQVYPLPETDYLRNRLTHTIEVSYIGQAIAASVMNKTAAPAEYKQIAQQIVSNGCLLHDIGNPPFGHSGEASIREFFFTQKERFEIIRHAFSVEGYKQDFLRFDGNSQGFRIATVLNGRKYDGGLRLSASSLCAMVKYPFPSSDIRAAKSKFGFMQSERSYFSAVFSKCGLVHEDIIYRSPFSLMVEAADDIAYLTADLEDAVMYGDIEYSQAILELTQLAGQLDNESIKEMKSKKDDISFIRSAAVTNMIRIAAKCIYENYLKDQILAEPNAPINLWGSDDLEDAERRIRAASVQKIYRGKKKMALQVAGGRIIKFVLDMQIFSLNELYCAFMKKTVSLESLDVDTKKELKGAATPEKYMKYLVDTIENDISREAAQVVLGMPDEIRSRLQHLFLASFKRAGGAARKCDPELAYGMLQLSLDFVAGTTDRYLSQCSKNWGGPTLI